MGESVNRKTFTSGFSHLLQVVQVDTGAGHVIAAIRLKNRR
jgi:hypothetical protein